MSYTKITEQSSLHDDLDQLSTLELLKKMNEEDKKVANALTEVIPNIEKLVEALVTRFDNRGRLFYICLLYTSPSPRDKRQSRMPSSA